MNGFEFAASVVGSLAWPVVVFLVVWVLRRPLRVLMGRLRSGKVAGIEVEFGEGVERAERSLVEALAEISVDQRPHDEPDLDARTPSTIVTGPADGADVPTVGAGGLPTRLRVDDALLGWDEMKRTSAAAPDPSVTVIRSWEALAEEVGRTHEAYGLRTGQGRLWTVTAMMGRLVRAEAVPAPLADSVVQLQKLRNEVAHGRTEPTPGEAAAFDANARSIREVLHNARANRVVS